MAAESDDIEQAIEKTIAPLNFVTRPVARGRLKRRNVAFPYFEVTVNESGARFRHEKGLDVTYSTPDVKVQAKAPDGSLVITHMSVEPVLTLSYDAEGGQRVDSYVLSGDGAKLTLSVRLTSARLPMPLQYKLLYRRTRK